MVGHGIHENHAGANVVVRVDSLITDLPLRAAAAYCWEWQQRRASMTGELDELSFRRDYSPTVWRRVVTAAESCGLPLETYMHAAWNATDTFPTVNNLHSDAMKVTCRRYAHGLEALLRSKLDTMSKRLVVLVRNRELAGVVNESPRQAAGIILAETQSTLSPLFRFCAAARLPNNALCDLLYEGAVSHYATAVRQYNATWGEYLSPELIDTVDNYLEARMRWLIRES